jgi:hypothetical protein
LTQQSDADTPKSVGCCVGDDGCVTNKFDTEESVPVSGCNGSDHDSNNELLS